MGKKALQVASETRESSLQDLRSALNGAFCERESLIDALLTGLIARENVFVLGPPERRSQQPQMLSVRPLEGTTSTGS